MYLSILKNPTIRKLSLVQLFAYFGACFSNVAIYSMILEFGVDEITNALVVSMFALPALLAPFTGSIVDKFEFKKFMILMLLFEFFMTSLYLTVTDIHDTPLLMLFIFFRMLAAFLFFNAEMALLPNLVEPHQLRMVNELHSIIWSVTFASGMALGGICVAMFGVYNTIMIDLFLFLCAISILFTIKIDIKKGVSEKIGIMIVEGFSYLKNHKMLWHLIFLHSAVALSSFDVLINLLTDYHYKYLIAIPLAIGWLNAIRALALMIGPIIIGKLFDYKNLEKLFFIEGIAIIFWALIQKNFYMSLIGIFFVGFFATTLWSYTYTLLQTHTEKKFLGRMVAYNDMIFMSVSILVSIFIGKGSELGLSLMFLSISLGVGFILFGFYYLYFRGTHRVFLESKSDD